MITFKSLKPLSRHQLRPPSLITLKEASIRYGMSVNALKKHVLKENIRGENLEGKVWLVRWRDVEKFLKVHESQLKRGPKRRYQIRLPFPATRSTKKKAGTLL